MKARFRIWIPAVLVIAAVVAPAYVRLFRVQGSSDAPTYLEGDRILVNMAAYDIRVPYTDIVVGSHSDPQRGDVVMFHEPGGEIIVFKRVIGCPGDTVSMRDHRLSINGQPLRYLPELESPDQEARHETGSVILRETGGVRTHCIAYAPEEDENASFGPVIVPSGHYFLMGDNRDRSRDSRVYGSVPRGAIVGRVGRPLR